MPLTITLDLEDSHGEHLPDGRWVTASERFLAWLADEDVRATIFVVGEAGRAAPQLVRRAADEGHEVALHGLRHVPLGESGPDHLAAELTEGRAILQDASGQEVSGFRAPIFSLTPATAWAVDAFAEAGVTYSSSILPASNPLHGWPGLPETPFAWDNGIVELPCPVIGVGRASLPFLGGIYVRYVPRRLILQRLAGARPDAVMWSYVHPYDIDAGEAIHRLPHASWPVSLVLHTRRAATMPRLRALLGAAGGGEPLGDIARRLADAGGLRRVEREAAVAA